MRSRGRVAARIAWVGCAAVLAGWSVGHAHERPEAGTLPPTDAAGDATGFLSRPSIYVEVGDSIRGTRYLDNATVELSSQTIWRPMCGGATDVSEAEFHRIAETVKAAGHAAMMGSGPSPSGSFDLIFNFTTAFPADAVAAIAELERYIESRFTDPVEVRINLAFSTIAGGALGGAGVTYVTVPWFDVRDGLIADADPGDTVHDYLPAEDTIPVRYDANSATVTAEDRVFVPVASYLAAIGDASGTSASLVFNNGVPWDFNPPVDPNKYSFRDVFVHEVGHALGFVSAVDTRAFDIELLDVFRFQRSDGAFNSNPDALEEFATTPRTVDYNPPPPADSNDDVISDIISAEYRMADGFPYQGSHFYPAVPSTYLMDPTFLHQETFSPDYLRDGDLAMLDAIGWDYPPQNTACEDALDIGCGNRYFDNTLAGGSVDPPFGCASGAEHDGAVWFRFAAESAAARISTCGSSAADSTIAVYEGGCGSLIEIACSEDDGCAGPGLSQVCLDGLVVGQTYHVQVAARTAADRGIYSLDMTCHCDAICADVCCHTADAPLPNPDLPAVSRFLSLAPLNSGDITALRVTFDSLYHPQPPNPPVPEPDFSAHEGLAQWVGPPADYFDDAIPPQSFRAAKLQCEPHFRDWGAEGLIHVTGPEIVPSSVFSVQAVDERCLTAGAGEEAFSTALVLSTSRWADVVPPYQNPEAVNPDQPNILDVSAIVDKVKGLVNAPSRLRAQLQPHDPEPTSIVNVLDISSAVDALRTYRYPFSGPRSCP